MGTEGKTNFEMSGFEMLFVSLLESTFWEGDWVARNSGKEQSRQRSRWAEKWQNTTAREETMFPEEDKRNLPGEVSGSPQSCKAKHQKATQKGTDVPKAELRFLFGRSHGA